MGEHDGDIARLEERSNNHAKEIQALKDSNKWWQYTTYAMLAKFAFDFFTKGTTQ